MIINFKVLFKVGKKGKIKVKMILNGVVNLNKRWWAREREKGNVRDWHNWPGMQQLLIGPESKRKNGY